MIDNGFARFNTIITSLKALDEGFSSKNYVRRFLRALHPKWRSKAKKESSDEDSSTFDSEDEEYAMAVRDFKEKMTRTTKTKESALNVENQIISSENAQNYQETIIKEPSLEDHGVITTKMKKKRLTTKNVLWLKHPMRSHHIDRCFSNVCLNCLYEINESIVPRFILDFYSQVTLQREDSGHILISFMIQNEFITLSKKKRLLPVLLNYARERERERARERERECITLSLSLTQFGQILKIPNNGQAVFINEWDLSSLAFFQETEGPYHADLPTPKEIHQFLRFERVDSNRTIKNKSVTLTPNQVLAKEVREDLKRWEELIRENVLSFGGHRDHLPATSKAHIPYGMFLTRLFRYVMEHYPHLDNGIYNVVDRVMRPLALRQTRRPRSDHDTQKARHFIPSSSTHHFRSLSHQEDDDNNEGTSRASTPSPNSYLNFLSPLDHQTYKIPTSSEQTDCLLFERQTTLLNQTQQIHKEARGGFKSFSKALKGVFGKKKK
nr:ribosomal protein L7Ae/L30e/S12e/Gadd45 [Tanacetum cinerariifolium]